MGERLILVLPRGRDRPCRVPDGDVNSRGRDGSSSVAATDVLEEVVRSRPTTRSSRDKEFSTADERREVSSLNRCGTPCSLRWRFHSWRRSGETSDLPRT